MTRFLLAAPLLLLGGCSNAGSVPEPHARAMLISACQASTAMQCLEAYMPVAEGLLPPGQRVEVNVPTESMHCPEDMTAVAACPQAGRIGVCDLEMRDGIGLMRFHVYPGGEQVLADCGKNDSARVYRF